MFDMFTVQHLCLVVIFLYSIILNGFIKAAVAHHPVIQKEVDELLTKGTIEPSTGGTGFYSSVLLVPKYMDGLHPILDL